LPAARAIAPTVSADPLIKAMAAPVAITREIFINLSKSC
jgi:hypothetical protein